MTTASARIRIMSAMSVDGFIATQDGGVAWLDQFNSVDTGYDDFLKQIHTVVMGRTTYEQVCGFDCPWPYATKKTVVLTTKNLTNLPTEQTTCCSGDVRDLVDDLRKAATTGDIWLVGGRMVTQAFLDARLVDEIELFMMPVLLNRGSRMFEPTESTPTDFANLKLKESKTFPNGVVKLVYNKAEGS
ncbi:uncharacterized protein YwjB-like [Branchiostoma lanceolatum]|uniref:uncharacterized protein YwjB-like n=1 Tax=Branchiostoma lanceolatum TaxID=7740 RepID=UPI0034537F31